MRALTVALAVTFFAGWNDPIFAQDPKKTFTIQIGSVTVTCTYSEGWLERNTVNGVNIFFGLISWGGSTYIKCHPGGSTCIVEGSVTIGFKGFTKNSAGEKSLVMEKATEGAPQMLINSDGKAITFAVNLDQVPAEKRELYEKEFWVVPTEFALGPNLVKQLKLYEGKEPMGFIIPAGSYPIKKDGNIRFWTWEKPQ